MKRLLAALLLPLFAPAAFAMPATEAERPVTCTRAGELRGEIEASLRALMTEHGYPGFAYAISGPGGATIIEGGLGVSDRATRAPMSSDTVFQIGSVTKVFTGALLARLAAEDRLELGDRLSEHWFAGDALAIDAEDRMLTLQAIATHTAGLPRYPSNLDREDGDPILGYPLALMREAMTELPAPEAERPDWDYSNFGYGVLAQAMARSQDTSFETLLREEILLPADLRDTGFVLSDEQRSRLATPYRDDDITAATQPWEMGAMSAAGGLFSTVVDLASFGSRLIVTDGRETEARMLQRAPLVRQTPTRAYGLGMFVVDDYVEGVDVLWHGGDVDGYAGSLVMLPDHGIAIAYMTNIGFAHGFAEFQRMIIARSAALCGDLREHP